MHALSQMPRIFSNLRRASFARTAIACARASHRSVAIAGALVATVLMSACGADAPTSTGAVSDHSLRLNLAPSINAGPGAVVEGILAYAPAGSTNAITLADNSIVISSTGTDASLSLAADVGPCRSAAAAAGTTCKITLTLQLKRDGALLDENVQQLDVGTGTQTVLVPAVTLFEVNRITVPVTALVGFEPGDKQTLTATAFDRTGAVVPARNVVWQVVSGGVTVSADGIITALTAGPAVVRVTIGGRSAPDIAFTVGPSTIATLTIAPLDTLISVGNAIPMRIVALSTPGAVLTGQTYTFSSSNAAIASVSATGVVSGVAVGTATITVRSTNGRNGVAVTAATTVRVQGAPPILVDRATVSLDTLPQNTSSPATTVAITTITGNKIAGLQAAVTYSPTVSTPWLTASISPLTTPAVLTLQASTVSLAPGDYAADVRLTSSTDAHVPATVHVTLRVVGPRRVVLSPKTVDFGALSSSQTTVPGTTVTVGSLQSVTLNGLATSVVYGSTVTGWFTAALTAKTAAPFTTLTLTPLPSGLPDGVYQARVIVTSTTIGAGPDTVNVQLTIASQGRFSGLVLNGQSSSPSSFVSVVTRRAADGAVVDSVITGSDGRFTTGLLPAGLYTISYGGSGYVATVLANQQLAGGAAGAVSTLPTIQLAPANSNPSTISGIVNDATTNIGVSGATLELRAGANNTTGPIIATTTSSTGSYSFGSRPAGTYTIRATNTGYASSAVTITVSGNPVVAPILFISPGTSNVIWRFVLSWGSTPRDLDAHLTGPIADSTSRFHVYWAFRGSSTSSPFVTLDVDQQMGNGPETITVWQQIPGIYRYYVNNFSGETPLFQSNARVDVYQGNTLINQFFVPSQQGTAWTVFEINGTTLTAINTLGTVQPSLVAPSSRSSGASAADSWFDLFNPSLTKPARAVRR
jgi:hypothetical protein